VELTLTGSVSVGASTAALPWTTAQPQPPAELRWALESVRVSAALEGFKVRAVDLGFAFAGVLAQVHFLDCAVHPTL